MKKHLITICFVLISACIATAQKLPGKQTVSLQAPTKIKIDGKATEWGGKFQAYNDATELYYTMANNDTELYLTVYCLKPSVIRRMMNSGLSLTINKSGKKVNGNSIIITYPIFDDRNKFYPVFKAIPAAALKGPPPAPVVSEVRFARPGVMAASEMPLTQTVPDSLMAENNTLIAARAKNISVIGVKGLDSLTSVYNDEGIKAAGQFDNKMGYVYELSISLKHLGLSVAAMSKFTYQLKVNDRPVKGTYVTNEDTGERSIVSGPPATDFWGEYTLAK